MFGQYRKFFMVSVAVTMLSFGLMTSNVSAESVKEYQNLETSLTNRNNKQFSFQELIEIANPYIVENFYSYSIVREDELKGKTPRRFHRLTHDRNKIWYYTYLKEQY